MTILGRAATLALVLLSAGQANAAYTITFAQVGNNVIATGTGSINTSALGQPSGMFNATTGVAGEDGFAFTGPAPASDPQGVQYTAFFSGPSSFGAGGIFRPNSGTGGLGGLEVSANAIFVSAGYISGTPILNSTSTFLNQTFASLGLTAGIYTEAYSATQGGGTVDSFVIQVGAASVPEPASMTMLGLGLAGAGGLARMRRRA